MDIQGQDINFLIVSVNKSDFNKRNNAKAFIESINEKFEDERISALLYEESSMADDCNEINIGRSFDFSKVMKSEVYLVIYYIYSSASYELNVQDLKNGELEGEPLLHEFLDIDGRPFFGYAVCGISKKKKEFFLELISASDISETRVAVFNGTALVLDLELGEKGYAIKVEMAIKSCLN